MIAKITMVSIGPPLIKKSDANKMLKRSLRDLGDEWHKKFRRPHFTQTAYTKYGYAPRSRRYNRFKKKAVGHTLPLVLTGTSRRLSQTRTIRATNKSVTVSMPIRVFNFKTRNSRVDKRKEFTTVAPSELKTLNTNAVKNLERRYRRYETKTELL